MAGKVLKIDVVIDENGVARRSLSELEGGVKKVEASAAGGLKSALESTKSSLTGVAAEAESVAGGMAAVESSAAAAGVASLALTGGMAAVLTVAGAAGATIYALGNYVKDATEYYIEQSGVLEINRHEIDALAASWDVLRYSVGELVVGGAGDYRSWINMVNVGLIETVTHIEAAIVLYERLIRLGKEAAIGGPTVNPFDPGETPGIDTTERNPDGTLTPYGRMLEQRRKLKQGPFGTSGGGLEPFSGTQAEAMTQAEITRQKQEQLALEREQAKEAAERLKLANEDARIQNELTQILERSRMEYQREIAAAEKLNDIRRQGLDLKLRDSFLQSSMGKGDYEQYEIGATADRKIKDIDPRASNAAELARRYTAEKELALIQLRQASEGLTQGIADDMNHFRAEYADVIGSLPLNFAEAIPPILAASGELRDGLSSDLDQVRGKTGQTVQSYALLGSAVQRTHEEIAAGLKAADEAYAKAGFFIQRNFDVTRLRGQQTGGLLYAGGGLVEPAYMARGGPAGTDTVPAWLTSGEGVLSRTGMAALDRLNAGGAIGNRGALHVTIEKGAIDARGAQFSDDRALESLAIRLQTKIAELDVRAGGTR